MTYGSIDLTEFEPRSYAPSDIPFDVGEALWRDYSDQVKVEFPGPPTDGKWVLTAQGWVGFIPLPKDFSAALGPKVGVRPGNIFAMLEYAYQLQSFRFLAGLVGMDSLQAFFESLVTILAKRTLDRARRGLYRSYVSEYEVLPFVRGRVDVPAAVRAPWRVDLPCSYEEHTADVDDNRILLWTLRLLLRSGYCGPRTRPVVTRAFRALSGTITLTPFGPEACTGRLYDRLNEDYRSLHALCRFFLDNLGPTHDRGDRNAVPFLVATDRLFEKFVAEWLKQHLPDSLGLEVTTQAHYVIERSATDREAADASASATSMGNQELTFDIDLTLTDRESGKTLAVLDTKYKDKDVPSTEDIAQVVAYAAAMGCRKAGLIFPTESGVQFPKPIGGISIGRLSFPLEDEIESAGAGFLKRLWRHLSALPETAYPEIL